MFITTTKIGEIIAIVSLQKSNASPGSDSILLKVIRNSITHFANHSCDTFNKSLLNYVFPDKLQLAKVLPTYKAHDRSSISNYN